MQQFASADPMPPAWVGSLGQEITSWTSGNADDGLKAVNLNISFPFEGASYLSAYISSNGFITLGGAPAGNDSQPFANSFELAAGPPRIALAWYDIDARDSGSIWYNSSIPGESVFTWESVGSYAPPPGGSVAASNLSTFQAVLKQNGDITLSYADFSTVNTGSPDSIAGSPVALIGVSSGGGTADPGPINLSLLTSAPGFAYGTVYSVLNNSASNGIDLSGIDLQLAPEGAGWSITAEGETAQIQATPEPAAIFYALSGIAALTLWIRKPKR